MDMDKRKIIEFLNKEWEKVKGEPSKIKEFYTRHRDSIDTLFVISSVPALLSSGLVPEIALMVGGGEMGVWLAKKAYEEKKSYGLGSIWETGEYESRKRLGKIL
jgi:hypothetical protein